MRLVGNQRPDHKEDLFLWAIKRKLDFTINTVRSQWNVLKLRVGKI